MASDNSKKIPQEMLIDAYAPETTRGEIEYWEKKEQDANEG